MERRGGGGQGERSCAAAAAQRRKQASDPPLKFSVAESFTESLKFEESFEHLNAASTSASMIKGCCGPVPSGPV